MAPIHQLVGSIAGHIATRVDNLFDSDGTQYQPPVESLRVVRLLQPMVDGQNELDFDFQGRVFCMYDQWDAAILAEQSQPPAGTETNEDNTSSSVVQPNTDQNAPAGGHTNSSNALETAVSCSFAAATATGDVCRTPRGRLALLEKTLNAENDVRSELLREEHAVRVRLLQENYAAMLQEPARKRAFQKHVEELELMKQKMSWRNQSWT
ncbi:uncharacterized protein LOC142588590 [Dermacentor variabilis]|uniref:uncharacterized protein LOC142588590 n=1 Tax=Dermacentor variabilis TaxID=34621 RepID=UPI003F5BCD22